MKTSRGRQHAWIFEAAAVFALFAYFLLQLRTEAFPTLFGARDFYRAAEWFHGRPVPYGPELSGGSFAPGPFFYLLTAIPLEFGGDWFTLNALKYLLAAAGGVGVWFIARRVHGFSGAAAMGLVYLNAFDLLRNLNKDWNASFQIFFSVAVIGFLFLAFERGRERGRPWLYAAFFTIALGLQVHGSFFIFLIVFAALQAAAPRLGWRRWDPRSAALAMIALALPLIPFFVWSIAGKQIPFFAFDPPPPLGAHSGLVDWFESRVKDMSLAFDAGSDWAVLRRQFDLYFLHNRLAVYAWPAALLLTPLLRTPLGIWPRRFGFLFAVMCVIYLQPFLAGMSTRYNFHWQAAFILFTGIYVYATLEALAQRVQSWIPRVKSQMLIVVVLAAAFCWTVPRYGEWIRSSGQWDRTAVDPRDLGNWTNLVVTQTAGLCREIRERTGWAPQEVVRRIFLVQYDDDIDLLPVCEAEAARAGAQPRGTNPDAIHGFFVVREVTDGKSADYWKTWWKEQPLPPEVARGIQSGEVELLEEKNIEGILLIPYRVKNPYLMPTIAGNVGFGYREAPGEDDLLRLPMPEKRGVLLADSATGWFYFNECRDRQKWCRSGVQVEAVQGDLREAKELRVRILGTPLSQRMSWHHQFMSMMWKDVSLLARCDGEEKKIALAGQIAKLRYFEKVEDFYFLTPLERLVRVDCKGRIESLSLYIGELHSHDNLSLSDYLQENVRLDLTL